MVGLRDWLRKNWYKKRPSSRVHEECWNPDPLVVWSMATTTTGFSDDCLSASTQDSPGAQFLSAAVTASATLHEHRAQVREWANQQKTRTSLSLRQYMQREFRIWERGRPPGGRGPPPPSPEDGEDSETDEEGWDTDSDGQESCQLSDSEGYNG